MARRVGEKEVARMGMLARVWTRARRQQVRTWSKEQAGFWDVAVAGSSCLRAMLVRRFRGECGVAMGVASISCMPDVSKFFDSLDADLLLMEMWRLGFPPGLLVLAFTVHWGARLLEAAGAWSGFVLPHPAGAAGLCHSL